MQHTRIFIMTIISSSLLFTGAGCGGGQVAVTPSSANGESALGDRPINLSGARPIRVDEETGKAEAITQAPQEGSAPPAPAAEDTMSRPTSFPGVLPVDEITGKQARIVTDKGEIVIELFGGDAPKTVSNFVALAKSGYYDGLTFHRHVPGFVIQGGDPLGDGTGGPGYKFEDEPVTRDYKTGSVAMANAGPDTNGSQFFIVLTEGGASQLGKLYNHFGVVTSGMDAVLALRQGDIMTSVTIEDKE